MRPSLSENIPFFYLLVQSIHHEITTLIYKKVLKWTSPHYKFTNHTLIVLSDQFLMNYFMAHFSAYKRL